MTKSNKTFEQKILDWLANGETGLSSKTIAFKMLGVDKVQGHVPRDPSDFKRCLKLVLKVPEIRPRLNEMREVSEQWAKLIDHWSEIENCFMEEVAEWLTNEFSRKRATKTYNLMKKIYN